MKSIKSLFAKIPITTYSRKVEPAVREIIAAKKAKHLPLIVVFRSEPDQILISRLKRMGFAIKHMVPFAKAVCGKLPSRSFDTLAGMLEVEKIFLDSKAVLMGQEAATADALKLPLSKPAQLTGKGVTVAFIDSGLYPHPALTRPRNRIAAFKDFVDGLDFPHDYNGHGTACIGAAFGASIDGSFKAIAYDADIVCAKAFDRFSTAFLSDILAAMQWVLDVRDKYNIKILVLPFGTTAYSKYFDLASRASQQLWNNGLFVCTCTGNLGPHDSSITSPGRCPGCFAAGACNDAEKPARASYFSGRGPVPFTVQKPDVLMPGEAVAALQSDSSYDPRNKLYYDFAKSGLRYSTITGTSVSASMAAAAAALVYQKNPRLTPDDVKSILRTCTVSVNELKHVQGAGMIDIKKLEEL